MNVLCWYNSESACYEICFQFDTEDGDHQFAISMINVAGNPEMMKTIKNLNDLMSFNELTGKELYKAEEAYKYLSNFIDPQKIKSEKMAQVISCMGFKKLCTLIQTMITTSFLM